MDMKEKALELLEFPKVRERLAAFTSFPASREQALSLTYSSEPAQVACLLGATAEALSLIAAQPALSAAEARDIRPSLQRAARGGVLEPPELLDILVTLTAFRQFRQAWGKAGLELPLLGEVAQGLVMLPALEREMDRCLDRRGQVADGASPALAALRREARVTQERLERRLEAILNSPLGQAIAQDSLITEREGRYVIPIKAERRGEMRGIVHDVSNTGATLFVEPLATVQLGNALRELRAQEQREVQRILADLSRRVAEHQETLWENLLRLAELDLALAKARYGRSLQACVPKLVASLPSPGPATPGLRLREARHPLLKGEVVPIDVDLGGEHPILVISGPNAGGKTVALKTIGLLALMAQAGLPIPVHPDSALPVCDAIFADIGDEQSIEESLSTFTWHMGNIAAILREATGRSLVLLDELGTGTDVKEGSALARAILLSLLARGSLAVATTHQGELKAFASATPGVRNAAVELDSNTLRPNYRLVLGIPGRSHALAIAQGLGLPAEVVEQARGFLSPLERELEALVEEAMRERDQAAAARQAAQAEATAAAQVREALQARLRQLEEDKEALAAESRRQVMAEVEELRGRLRRIETSLQAEAGGQLPALRRELLGVRREIRRSQEGARDKAQKRRPQPSLVVGQEVWVASLNQKGVVLALPEGHQEAEVQVGRLTVRVPREDLAPAPIPTLTPAGVALHLRGAEPPPLELDLRGIRVPEGLERVERYLNDVFLARRGRARLIHGKGTGAMRRAVLELLASHPLVRGFQEAAPPQGGAGATEVELAL
ncbi:MAG: endonuclease MutS2 [Chloroflexi bacterium]|nr:endonuclease MutS2 [Chloroflexota bacterium]